MIFSDFRGQIEFKYGVLAHINMRLRGFPVSLHDSYGTTRTLVCITNAYCMVYLVRRPFRGSSGSEYEFVWRLPAPNKYVELEF